MRRWGPTSSFFFGLSSDYFREEILPTTADPTPSNYLLRQLSDTQLHPGHTPSSAHLPVWAFCQRSLSIVTHLVIPPGQSAPAKLLAIQSGIHMEAQRKEIILLICKSLQKYSIMVLTYIIFSRSGRPRIIIHQKK